MKRKTRLALPAACCAAALTTGCASLWKREEAGSMGIIGGADGPTAIFVTTGGLSPAAAAILLGAVLLAVIAGVVLLIRGRHK